MFDSIKKPVKKILEKSTSSSKNKKVLYISIPPHELIYYIIYIYYLLYIYIYIYYIYYIYILYIYIIYIYYILYISLFMNRFNVSWDILNFKSLEYYKIDINYF